MKLRYLFIVICASLTLGVSAQKSAKKGKDVKPAAEAVKEETPRDTAAMRAARREKLQRARAAFMKGEEERARELGLDTAQLHGIQRLDRKRKVAKNELRKQYDAIDQKYEEDVKQLLGEELYAKYLEKMKEMNEKAINPSSRPRPQRNAKQEKSADKKSDNNK